MAILKQKTAFGPGVYRGHPLPLETLKKFVEGTNKAIAAGVPIPLLLKHAPINASDKDTEQFASSDGQGAGWITKVDIEDGAISWEAKDVPDKIVEAKEQGRLKFTSPEFRPNYVCEKAGVYEGPVIRHFAFTPLPGNPHQGEIMTLALSEGCWQFTEGDCQPLPAMILGEDLDAVTAPSPVPGDSEYKDSLSVDAHKPGVTNPSESGESIDWDNLSVQEHSKILDEIANGLTEEDHKLAKEARFNKEHGGLHMLKEDFGSTGNPSWMEDEGIWDKAKKAIGNKYGGEGSDKHWAVVTAVYKKMGGRVKHSSQHAEERQKIKVKHLKKGHVVVSLDTGIRKTITKDARPTHKGYYRAETDHASGPVNMHGDNEVHIVANHQHAEDPKSDNPMDEEAKKKKQAEDTATEENAEESQSSPPDNLQPDVNTNPDAPPKATDKSKLAAVIAGLNQKNIVLPSDFCFDDDSSIDVLLAAINSSIKAEQDAEAEAEPDEDEQGGNNVTDAPMPFSEQDLEALPARVRAAILKEQESLKKEREARKQAEQKALQYEEEKEALRNSTAKKEAVDRIKSYHIPPVIKSKLLAAYESEENTIQFAEGTEKPSYTALEVAEMLAASLPPSLQFEVEDVKESEAPKGQQQIGTDAFGNPVYRQADSEQFFETAPDGQLLGALHVSPEKAEEFVKASPIGQILAQGRGTLPPPTPMNGSK